ncbi:MAG: metallophosphoesterase [Rhodospirillaceae bacterium]
MTVAEGQIPAEATEAPPATDMDEGDASTPERRRQRRRRFARKAFWILALAHAYVGLRLAPNLPGPEWVPLAAAVILCVSAVLVPFGTFAKAYVEDPKIIDRLAWAGGITMGWFSSLLVLTVFRDMTMVVPAVRALAPETAAAVPALALAVTLVGFVNARRTARVVDVTIPIAGLPAALEGFTIVQITDVHVGPTIKRGYVEGIVRRVNALDADAIAVTGDIVDGPVEQLAHDAAPLGDLRARHGAYVVTGNHEYYAEADAWMAEFARLGLTPLRNEHVVIQRDGASLVMAGVNDFSATRLDPKSGSDPAKAVAGAPAGAPKVLLAHQPRSAAAAMAAGFDLQLSGHTHGGQFWPWNHFVRMQQPYTAGLHRHGDLFVYTSRGTGYWGPPKRFGAPSEITRIRLTAGGEPHKKKEDDE